MHRCTSLIAIGSGTSMSERYEIVLTCPKGLEGLLLEEAKALGLEMR